MNTAMNQRNLIVKDLLNGTISSLQQVIPVKHKIIHTKTVSQAIQLQFGVLIGITGDIKGKLILSSHTDILSQLGETMFGMRVEREMLHSFSGELGNMIAGSLSTHIVEKGIKTDITAPTIMEGHTSLSGYKQALQVSVRFDYTGEMDIYLLLD